METGISGTQIHCRFTSNTNFGHPGVPAMFFGHFLVATLGDFMTKVVMSKLHPAQPILDGFSKFKICRNPETLDKYSALKNFNFYVSQIFGGVFKKYFCRKFQSVLMPLSPVN